jgi:hypothetical protein
MPKGKKYQKKKQNYLSITDPKIRPNDYEQIQKKNHQNMCIVLNEFDLSKHLDRYIIYIPVVYHEVLVAEHHFVDEELHIQ